MGTVQQPLLCVVHIPKTAGSAIRETLISSLGPEKVYWIGHKRPYAHWESAAGTEFDDYAVVGGHRSAAAFQKIKRPKIFMAVVRDPIERAVSLFNYIIRGPDSDHGLRGELQGLGLAAAIEKSPKFRWEVQDRQCALVGGAPIFAAALQSICENEWLIDRHENIVQLFARTCDRFGWPTLPLVQDNVGEKGYAERLLSGEVIANLKKINQEDGRLAEIFQRAPGRNSRKKYADRDAIADDGSAASNDSAAVANPATVAEELVAAAYKAVLGRRPDPSGLHDYTKDFRGVSLAHWVEHTVRSLLHSKEFDSKWNRDTGKISAAPSKPETTFFTPEQRRWVSSLTQNVDRIVVARFRAIPGSRPTLYLAHSSLLNVPRVKLSLDYKDDLVSRYALHQDYYQNSMEIFSKRDGQLFGIFQIGDHSEDLPGTLGYVGIGENVTLLPDVHFWMSKGYFNNREAFRKQWLPWSDRIRVVFWRGSSTGAHNITVQSLSDLPRFRLCAAAAERKNLRGVLDAKLTKVVQASSTDEAERVRGFIESHGLLSPHVAQADFLKYKFQVDIDGNTNSWGFIIKLLMGSCVLKIRSPWSQWYYSGLRPWEHYIPLQDDLSDLEEQVEWCLANDTQARQIAENGMKYARAEPHWLESLKGDSGTIESVIRCPDRKMLGDGDGLAAGTELFGGSAGAGAGGG